MENISSKKLLVASSQEDNAPSVKDEWAREIVFSHSRELEYLAAKVADIEEYLKTIPKKHIIAEWQESTTIKSTFVYGSIDIPINIKTTFEKLKEEFSNFSNRILWCNELKNCLSKFEEELEEYDAKYLSWFVSTLKDVFSYNYAETITEEQLDLLKNGVETIYEKQEKCDKDSFAEYHLKLVESGLSLLPNTQKAIDELGE